MSRDILNPNILETIPNQQVLQPVMIAPSNVLQEAWESTEFKLFYTKIFNNLFEDTQEEKKVLEDKTKQIKTVQNEEPNGELSHLTELFDYTQEKWSEGRYHYRWNITKEEIEDEMARQFAEKVSFIFVLKWLQQKSKKSPLH
jgi:hypothetical protein